jgi:hypothetical protein
MKARTLLTSLCLAATLVGLTHALERPDVEFKIFQFPPDRIPRIDGKADDWEMVPLDYGIGQDQLKDTVHGCTEDLKDLDVRVRVGWVKGMNQLWFLYEASDNYWDFSRPGLQNDIFEIVVDGDLSGGPLIKHFHPHFKTKPAEAHFSFHGVHAQNYHIFTPALDKDWAMIWGCQPWIKDLPYANAAYSYDFKPGGSGRLVLEFWITPFDFAPADGPERAVVSRLRENKLIGLSWAILDYDSVESDTYKAFWNLSHKATMYGDASDLCAFRLMPLVPALQKPIAADWSFKVIDHERRSIGFTDRSTGKITSWRWDFGDGKNSTERHPVHTYAQGGEYIVILDIEGPDGKARRAKVWDVVFK